jgi:Tol biopolymer transport system component
VTGVEGTGGAVGAGVATQPAERMHRKMGGCDQETPRTLRRVRPGPWLSVARVGVVACLAVGAAACSSTTPSSTAGSSTGSSSSLAPAPTGSSASQAPATPGGSPIAATGLIAFVWRDQGTNKSGLATIHADGTGRTEIADTSDATEPALSPDGSLIAYTRSGADQGIWIMKVDGTDRHRVAHIAGQHAEGAAWSPDGKRLAFVELPTTQFVGNREIWLVNADGSEQTKLTDQSSGDRPTWSPDGTRIAFASFAGGGIYGIGIDGKGLAPITGGPDLSPAWAPDGRRLAFQRQDDSDPNAVVSHIFVVFGDGTNLEQLTKGTTDDQQPAWAPDGTALVYGQFATTPNGKVIADLVVLAPGGAATDLTSTPGVSEYLPSWR